MKEMHFLKKVNYLVPLKVVEKILIYLKNPITIMEKIYQDITIKNTISFFYSLQKSKTCKKGKNCFIN